MISQKSFPKKLLKWHEENPRPLPWKKTKDPYKIWLSEIILQQTRVEQGTPYFNKLTKLFPTLNHLERASEDEVMRSWQGLGYYSRARNLHAAAKQIVYDFRKKFPASYESILKLKGVGPYTAAAIASFAFDLPHAVVDGNVFRVLARIFGVKASVDSSEGKKVFAALAHHLLDKKNSAAYNQAIMNFGAMICLPANPLCGVCCFKKDCFAFRHNVIGQFPVKKKKGLVRTRWFNFLVIEKGDEIIIEKRTEDDIWKSLFQFPLVETDSLLTLEAVIKFFSQKKILPGNCTVINISPLIEHQLTHQKIMARFLRISSGSKSVKTLPEWKKVKKRELKNFAFPKLISNYIEKYLH